jgi:hypothetical protein
MHGTTMLYFNNIIFKGRRGRDRMVVGFITTNAISAYHSVYLPQLISSSPSIQCLLPSHTNRGATQCPLAHLKYSFGQGTSSEISSKRNRSHFLCLFDGVVQECKNVMHATTMLYFNNIIFKGRRGRDRMVVGFITTNAISAYQP